MGVDGRTLLATTDKLRSLEIVGAGVLDSPFILGICFMSCTVIWTVQLLCVRGVKIGAAVLKLLFCCDIIVLTRTV